MRRIKVTNKNFEYAFSAAIEIIKQGGVVAIPTDTSYGLAADALNEESVLKVFRIKRRSLSKPLSIFVDSVKTIEKYFIVDEVAAKLISLLPERLTLILKAKDPSIFPRGIANEQGGVGVRLPPSIYPVELVRATKTFLTATSANLSGKPPIYNPFLIEKELRDVDLILDAGVLKRVPTSTVIDLTSCPPAVIREGSVPLKTLEKRTGLRFSIKTM